MQNKDSAKYKLSHGFTLIEVLITLAIIAILLNTGVFGYSQLIDSAQNQKTADSLKAAIAQARGESITHGGNVRICGSSDGNTCTGSFDGGWISYHDQNIDALLSAADTILTRHEIDYSGTTIVATDRDGNDKTDFGFNYRGYPALPVTLEVGAREGASTVQVHASGRVEIQ